MDNKYTKVPKPAPIDIVTDTEDTEGPEKLNPNDMHDLVYRTYSLGKVFRGNQIFILKDDLLSVMENLKEIAVVCDGKLFATIPYEDTDWSCDIVRDEHSIYWQIQKENL